MTEPEIPADWYRRPNIARIYDYWLDGTQHLPIDREVADQMDATHPNIRPAVLSNRLFLRRAVALLAEQGITQFLDIGTGLPTGGTVHTVAMATQPSARVAYVDNDPLVVRLSQLLLQEEQLDSQAVAIVGDVRAPEEIVSNPTLASLLDFQQPIAVLCLGLLYFIPDDEQVRQIIKVIHDRMAPGSYLVISHLDFEAMPDASAEEARRIYERSVTRIQPRTITQVAALLEGFELIEPGMVYISAWRPSPATQFDPYGQHPEQSSLIGAIGRKV